MSPHQSIDGTINTGVIAYRQRKMIPEQNVHHISNIKLGENPSSRMNGRNPNSKFDVMDMRPAGVKKSLKVVETS
jgi:hypothetical protein